MKIKGRQNIIYKRVISFIMCFCLLFSCFSLSSFAGNLDGDLDDTLPGFYDELIRQEIDKFWSDITTDSNIEHVSHYFAAYDLMIEHIDDLDPETIDYFYDQFSEPAYVNNIFSHPIGTNSNFLNPAFDNFLFNTFNGVDGLINFGVADYLNLGDMYYDTSDFNKIYNLYYSIAHNEGYEDNDNIVSYDEFVGRLRYALGYDYRYQDYVNGERYTRYRLFNDDAIATSSFLDYYNGRYVTHGWVDNYSFSDLQHILSVNDPYNNLITQLESNWTSSPYSGGNLSSSYSDQDLYWVFFNYVVMEDAFSRAASIVGTDDFCLWFGNGNISLTNGWSESNFSYADISIMLVSKPVFNKLNNNRDAGFPTVTCGGESYLLHYEVDHVGADPFRLTFYYDESQNIVYSENTVFHPNVKINQQYYIDTSVADHIYLYESDHLAAVQGTSFPDYSSFVMHDYRKSGARVLSQTGRYNGESFSYYDLAFSNNPSIYSLGTIQGIYTNNRYPFFTYPNNLREGKRGSDYIAAYANGGYYHGNGYNRYSSKPKDVIYDNVDDQFYFTDPEDEGFTDKYGNRIIIQPYLPPSNIDFPDITPIIDDSPYDVEAGPGLILVFLMFGLLIVILGKCIQFLFKIIVYCTSIFGVQATSSNLNQNFVYGLNVLKGTQGIGENGAPLIIPVLGISIFDLLVILFEIGFIGGVIVVVRKLIRHLDVPK